ncbi:hypothetical protein ACS0TY_013784 [Phlomoides rotata]
MGSYTREPWLIGGDFNEIKNLDEKRGGGSRTFKQMSDFVDVIEELGMRELLTTGSKFTWLNKRKGWGRIWERLDRFVANDDWCDRFPKAKVVNGDFYGSDHRDISIQLFDKDRLAIRLGTKRFMFKNKWMMEAGYSETVRMVWAARGTWCSLVERLRACGQKNQTWAYEHSGCILKKIKWVSKQLEACLCNDELKDNSDEIGKLEAELEKLYS